MALSPTQVKELSRRDLRRVARTERRIDRYLTEQYRDGYTINYIFDRDIKQNILSELGRRYTEAGWIVKESDRCLSFSHD